VTASVVKVSRSAVLGPEKPGAFRLQNYWISQPERMFLGPAN